MQIRPQKDRKNKLFHQIAMWTPRTRIQPEMKMKRCHGDETRAKRQAWSTKTKRQIQSPNRRHTAQAILMTIKQKEPFKQHKQRNVGLEAQITTNSTTKRPVPYPPKTMAAKSLSKDKKMMSYIEPFLFFPPRLNHWTFSINFFPLLL